jgi:serine/threonine-protein kinase
VNPGELVSGKYRLLRQLGRGGMGSVWAARNQLTDRDFAIKFLLPDLATNKEALQRFFLEARACGQIKHPAVVEVYDMGQAEDGSPYLVMELLEGEGFDQRIARQGAFRPGEAVAWLAFVARGLAEAHARGLVHRDLKPGNVFITYDAHGEVLPKLLDFGVSKTTGLRTGDDFVKTTTGAVLGSPAYMSPEQARGETDIDGRSDIWSLGVILYEALTGRIPFDAANYNALMLAIITREHQPIAEIRPGVPRALSELVDATLTKDRAKRIATANELAERLEALAMTMTDAPVRFVPGAKASISGVSPPVLVPAPARQFSTTEGTWSEGRKTAMMRGRSSVYYVAGALLLTAAAIGAVAVMQLRGPMVAVAGRSELTLTKGLAGLRHELDVIQVEDKKRVEAEAAPRPSAEPEAPSTEPATTSFPSVHSRPGSAAPHNIPRPAGKPRKGPDPHGGVDSAGF